MPDGSAIVLALDPGHDGAALLAEVNLRSGAALILGGFRWTRWAHDPPEKKLVKDRHGNPRKVPMEWDDVDAFFDRLAVQDKRWALELQALLAIRPPDYWTRETHFVSSSRGSRDLRHYVSVAVVRSQKDLVGWFRNAIEQATDAIFVPVKPVGEMEATLAWREMTLSCVALADLGAGRAGKEVRDAAGVLRSSISRICRREAQMRERLAAAERSW